MSLHHSCDKLSFQSPRERLSALRFCLKHSKTPKVSIVHAIYPERWVLNLPGILVSNCIVVYLRFLTSATIKTDPDSYLPYIFDPETGDDISLLDFCQRHVEACGKEAGELQDIIRRHLVFILFVDNVQISALTKSLKINIEIAYLDGHSADGTVNFVSFQNLPETDVPNPPILLYRYARTISPKKVCTDQAQQTRTL